MRKIHCIFTQHFNSFSVYIDNLEQLTVKQIQEIQQFVKVRHGIFDFETYTFVIQKRLDFNAFVSLVKNSNLNAVLEENIPISSNGPRIGFGNYKGMLYSEIPDSYLIWLQENHLGSEREKIVSEYKSRNL